MCADMEVYIYIGIYKAFHEDRSFPLWKWGWVRSWKMPEFVIDTVFCNTEKGYSPILQDKFWNVEHLKSHLHNMKVTKYFSFYNLLPYPYFLPRIFFMCVLVSRTTAKDIVINVIEMDPRPSYLAGARKTNNTSSKELQKFSKRRIILKMRSRCYKVRPLKTQIWHEWSCWEEKK